jgi:glyoxylase-like metal-dependent hydrolase (beta-lactamase superfamily II)
MHFHMEQLSERTYAAIAKDGGGAIANGGIVDLGEYLVIFDSFLTPAAASELKVFLKREFSKPVKYLVNSHYHNDHIRGNQIFSPTTTIIATDECRKLIDTKGREELIWDNRNANKQLKSYSDQFNLEKDEVKKREIEFWIYYYEHIIKSLPEIKITLPDLTFKNKLILNGTKRTVEIINTDEGHTLNDVIMYTPEEKILFAGDLVFAKCHPYLGSGHIDNWVNSLRRMKALDIRVIIPGHGPVGTKKDIDLMIQYINDLLNIAANIRDKDQSAQQEIMKDIPIPYENWLFGEIFYPMNLKFIISYINKIK